MTRNNIGLVGEPDVHRSPDALTPLERTVMAAIITEIRRQDAINEVWSQYHGRGLVKVDGYLDIEALAIAAIKAVQVGESGKPGI